MFWLEQSSRNSPKVEAEPDPHQLFGRISDLGQVMLNKNKFIWKRSVAQKHKQLVQTRVRQHKLRGNECMKDKQIKTT